MNKIKKIILEVNAEKESDAQLMERSAEQWLKHKFVPQLEKMLAPFEAIPYYISLEELKIELNGLSVEDWERVLLEKVLKELDLRLTEEKLKWTDSYKQPIETIAVSNPQIQGAYKRIELLWLSYFENGSLSWNISLEKPLKELVRQTNLLETKSLEILFDGWIRLFADFPGRFIRLFNTRNKDLLLRFLTHLKKENAEPIHAIFEELQPMRTAQILFSHYVFKVPHSTKGELTIGKSLKSKIILEFISTFFSTELVFDTLPTAWQELFYDEIISPLIYILENTTNTDFADLEKLLEVAPAQKIERKKIAVFLKKYFAAAKKSKPSLEVLRKEAFVLMREEIFFKRFFAKILQLYLLKGIDDKKASTSDESILTARKTDKEEQARIENPKTKLEEIDENTQKPKDKTEENIENNQFLKTAFEEEYVLGAGLVLLHPFLNVFFETNQLTDENNTFSDIEKRAEAVYALHFMCTGDLEPEEPETAMARFLCRWNSEESLPAIVLRDELKKECEELLQTVIEYIPALSESHIDALRGNFLIRNGKISKKKDDSWLVQVEKEPFDLLLDKVPWSLGVARLPWFEQMIWIEWL